MITSNRPLLLAKPIVTPSPPLRIHSEFTELHEKWFEHVIKSPSFSYQVEAIPSLPPPQTIPYNNDFNLNEEDITNWNGKLENGPILQFLNRSTKEIDIDSLGIDMQPISKFVSSQSKDQKKDILKIPYSYQSISEIYLKVSVETVSIPGSSTQISGSHGMLFLYDIETKTVLSDPSFFTFSSGKPVFIQTTQTVSYFQIRKPLSKSLVLACALFHENAAAIETFFESLTTGCAVQSLSYSTPVPFAFSYLNPLEGELKKTFLTPWTKVNSSDSFKNIGQPPDEETSVSLNGIITAEVVKYEEIPDFCLSTDANRAKPLLALSSLPQISCPVSSFLISGIQILFNNSPKGEFIYFKLYVCKDQTDPYKPDGIKCLASRSKDLLLDCYQSFPILAGRKVYFPDIIRIYTEKPLPATAHLIFQVIAISHNQQNICKICALPLFQDGALIQNNPVTVPISPLKRIKAEDYLTKIKSNSKTNVVFNFSIPIYLYPPKCLIEFATALVPQQINWGTITSQTAPDVLIPMALPIISKLLRLISPSTAEFLLDYIYKLRATDVKEITRCWVYKNFDPKAIKHNFTSSFTNSFDQLIQVAIESSKPEIITQFVYSFELLMDILFVSYQRRTESWIPVSIFNLFSRVTQLVCFLIKAENIKLAEFLNKQFGVALFVFQTLCEDPAVFGSLKYHLRSLINLDNSKAFYCVFEFMLPFSETKDFAIFVSTQLPVRPLNKIMFSPFHPIVSLLCLAINKTMTSDEHALGMCVQFLYKLFIPMELIEPTLSYRVGFAFFPILDILSSFFASELVKPFHFTLLPIILFLLGYTPTQLIKNFFSSMSPNFQTLFIEFLSYATEACIAELTDQITIVNGLFDQLTQRCIQFLWRNLDNFSDSLPSVIKLVSLLVCPHQIPHNFPRIFDIVSSLIKIYPCQRLLVTNLLEVLTRKQHIARCFATSLILLFFKADFDERRTVTVSSVEVIDALTSLLLHSPIEQISMYKQMIAQIQSLSPFFKNETLTAKLNERMIAANNIADVIEKLRLASHPPDERCIYVMQIANQHKTFPSMRMKWLKEIVRINVQNGCFPSAFVAQLHICALISTVFMHEEKLSTTQAANPAQGFNFNLIVSQPIRNARITSNGIGKYNLSEKDFSFIPSVLVETQIDFESISSDFQFIASDFTIDLLKQAIEDAISYGEKSRLYYDVRCLLSLQMRIFATERKYGELAKVASGLSANFRELTASTTPNHDTPLLFFVNRKKVYCVDSRKEKELVLNDCILVAKYDPATSELEHLHSWKRFREIVKKSDLERVSTADAKEIKLVQYTTKEELPRYTMFSEISDIETVMISLTGHAELETEKLRLTMQQSSIEFEKCFPCRNLVSIEGNYKQNIERDMGRIVALFRMALQGEDSVFELLKLLRFKERPEKAQELAAKIRFGIERLLKVYHRGIEYLQSPNHFLIFKEMRELILSFTTEFQIQEINSKSYEGRKDPLTEHIEYEIN